MTERKQKKSKYFPSVSYVSVAAACSVTESRITVLGVKYYGKQNVHRSGLVKQKKKI